MPHCRTDGQGLTYGRGLPPPCRAAGRPTAPSPSGGYLPPGCRAAASPRGQNTIKTNFIYIQVPTARQEGGRGPAAPQPGGRGTKL